MQPISATVEKQFLDAHRKESILLPQKRIRKALLAIWFIEISFAAVQQRGTTRPPYAEIKFNHVSIFQFVVFVKIWSPYSVKAKWKQMLIDIVRTRSGLIFEL